jgi:hypothetical protein
MRKKLVVCGLICALFPLHIDSQSASPPPALHLRDNSRDKAHGWIRISTPGIVGDLSCFFAELHGGYASIGGGGVKRRDDVSIQMNFLSRAGTHSCKVPTVLIEFQQNRERWDAYQVGHSKFGDCSITQVFKDNRKIWKGHAVASLVIVKGDTTNGSPRFLHTEKDSAGNPMTRMVEIAWEFDRLTQVPD